MFFDLPIVMIFLFSNQNLLGYVNVIPILYNPSCFVYALAKHSSLNIKQKRIYKKKVYFWLKKMGSTQGSKNSLDCWILVTWSFKIHLCVYHQQFSSWIYIFKYSSALSTWLNNFLYNHHKTTCFINNNASKWTITECKLYI